VFKITKHITFFYDCDRFQYINRIIQEVNKYKHKTDIFIHTNRSFNINLLNKNNNGSINIVKHSLLKINPFYLSWKCRDLMKQQKDEYDIFIYVEDDILILNEALEYWIEHNSKLIEMNYNLGFIRIEVKDGEEYMTDILRKIDNTLIDVDGHAYVVNNVCSYYAMWIYNKGEFNKFTRSKYYNGILNNANELIDVKKYPKKKVVGRSIREKSARGFQYCYKNTIIPVKNNKLVKECRIYHLPNNYVNCNRGPFAVIKFNDAINTHPQ